MLAKSELEWSIELLFELYVYLCIFLKLMHEQSTRDYLIVPSHILRTYYKRKWILWIIFKKLYHVFNKYLMFLCKVPLSLSPNKFIHKNSEIVQSIVDFFLIYVGDKRKKAWYLSSIVCKAFAIPHEEGSVVWI